MTNTPESQPELSPEQEERIRRAREKQERASADFERARREYYEARERLLKLARRR
jgi:hypothetical protein